MALTPQTEASGLKAYEQARAFERLRSWRLPLSYALFALVPVLSGIGMWVMGFSVLAGFNFLGVVVVAWMARSHWKGLRAGYARNLRLLAEMEKEHGDQLPWIQVEKHFAALEELKRSGAPAKGPADGSKT